MSKKKKQRLIPFHRFWIGLLVMGTVLNISFPASGSDFDPKQAIVKIYTVFNRPNYHEPWQMKGQQSLHGSGCIIQGGRILTNAHVVSDSTFIEVRRAGSAEKFPAEVEMVGHDCDLAILRVRDTAFFEGVRPLPFGDLPMLRDRVVVYGFPDGGDKLSTTEGVVSRVENLAYRHSNAFLLSCQIDASINAGSSGGPVVKDGHLVGVAFQSIAGERYENIGYMVPAPVVRHFMADIQDGRYDGIPGLAMAMQKLENPDMRKSLDMPNGETGVLINRMYPGSPAEGLLQPGDILLEIDGWDIANDGTIEFRPGERTYFGYRYQMKQMGERVSLRFLRNAVSGRVELTLDLPIDKERLVPHRKYDQAPNYYIFGGLVFEPLSLNYLHEYGSERDWFTRAPVELTDLYLHGQPSVGRRQVVILVKVLADEMNAGYHGFVDTPVHTVNGQRISTMKMLVDAFENHRGRFHVIEDTHGFRIVVDGEKARTQTPKILERYRIRSDRSANFNELGAMGGRSVFTAQ